MNTQTNPQQPQPSTSEEVPEGHYRAKALGEEAPHVLYGTSSNGNDEMAIEMQLLDLNRPVFVVLNFSEAAMPFSLERLRALGWTEGPPHEGITKNEVQVRAKRETFTGQDGTAKTKTKYEIMTGNGRFSFSKPMDDQQKKGFFARLNAYAKQSPSAPKAGGYPADWDQPGAPAAAGKPRVNL